MRRLLLAGIALLGLVPTSFAHDGPPYPVLVDEPFGELLVSVWADPDVGIGTFYIYLPDEPPAEALCARLTGWSVPSDGHLERQPFEIERAEERAPYEGIAEVEFDRRGAWRVGFVLAPAADDPSGTPTEIVLDIEVTPPGSGPIDLVWFLVPFLLVAFLWGKAIHQRASYAKSATQDP